MPKQKLVTYIDPMSYSNLGEYDYSLVSNLRDFDINFVGNKKFKHQLAKPIKQKLIFNYSDKKGVFKIASYLISVIRLFFLLIYTKPQLIHIQWIKLYRIDFCLYRLIKLLLPHTQIVFTAHNILPHDTRNKHKVIFMRFYSLCDHIIVHTDVSKSDFTKMFNVSDNKISVIRHGIFELRYDINEVDKQSQLFKEKFDLRNKTVISALGNISEYKGTDILIQAWERIETSIKQKAVLVIAGKGNLKQLDEIGDNSNIIVLNKYLTDNEFNALLNITDLMVLPYREISQSGLLLTALGAKIPVLVSQVGGLIDPLSISHIGWKLPKDFTKDDLTKTLENTISQKDLLYDLKNNNEAWSKIKVAYDWSEIGLETTELYYRILTI